MELHQLRYFVAAAEAGSFSKAARACHVAQPSLSQQIRKLEEGLGARLFDRVGRGAVLTEAGGALLPRARRILGEVRDAEDGLRGELDPLGGSITIGAIPTVAPFVLPRLLTRLRAERPRCEVSVREDVTSRLLDALADHEIDCALVSVPAEHPLVEVEELGKERLLVATPRDRRWEDSAMTLAALREAPAIVLHEMHCLSGQVEGFCAAKGLAPRVVCRGAQLQTVLGLVSTGMGVSIVPEMCAATDRDPGRRYAPIARANPTRSVAIAWRKGRTRPGAATLAAEIVRDMLRGPSLRFHPEAPAR